MTATAEDIVREARALVGTPYRNMGRTELGLDCIGLAYLAGKRAGVDMDSPAWRLPRRYGRVPEARRYAEVIARCAPCGPRAAALTLFRFPGETDPRHFALLTGQGTIIHAEAQQHRRVVEHGFRAHWEARSTGFWMLPGVTYV